MRERMKPFYIARRTERRERADRYLPWILVPVFVTGLIVSKVWPAYEPALRVAFYVGCAVFGAYVIATLVLVTREPVNYKFLRLTDAGIEYADASPGVQSARWGEIESVIFYRDEALFEDMGPYLESMWLVKKRDGKTFEVMNEVGNRGPLLRAFREYLPGFDAREARRGIRAWRTKGKWVCLRQEPKPLPSADGPGSGCAPRPI